MKHLPLFITILLLTLGCRSQSDKNKIALTEKESHLCDSLKIEPSIILDLREHTAAKLEPFHYSLGRLINSDGTESEIDPIHLPGFVFKETAANTELLLDKLHNSFKTKGYTLFTLDRNFGLDGTPDVMAILKTADKFDVLKQIKTDGINFDIDNDSLVKIMKVFDSKYALDLVGASGDWCEFKIEKEPEDWLKFANEVYEVCPDVVDQGTGTVESLAEEMKNTRRLYFWWD